MSASSGKELLSDDSVYDLAKALYYYLKDGTDFQAHDISTDGDNASLTVLGETDKNHYISSVIGSFEADNQAGRIEVESGGDILFTTFITGQPVDFEPAVSICCACGTDISVTLYNDSNKKCAIYIAGYTKDVI